MKIYTKTGDEGTTALIGGVRVSKSHERVEAYGTIDELNAHLGLIRDLEVNSQRKDFLYHIQHELFVIGAMLATDPGHRKGNIPTLQEEQVEAIEKAIDHMQAELPPMHHFILPGGHTSVSFCHIARCVCRRAERMVVRLHEKERIEPLIIIYLNRLSDYFFVLARKVAQELNVEEIYWKSKKENKT